MTDERAAETVIALERAARLTFDYVSHRGSDLFRRSRTEVYRRDPDGWRIILTPETHRPFTGPPGAVEEE